MISFLKLPFRRRPPAARPATASLRWFKSDSSFRSDPALVTWARSALSCVEGQRLQAYLFAHVPQSIAYRGDSISTIQACQEYFRLVGYLECLAKLQEAATTIPVEPPELEADYDQTPPSGTTE